jgi:hypothetical protein
MRTMPALSASCCDCTTPAMQFCTYTIAYRTYMMCYAVRRSSHYASTVYTVMLHAPSCSVHITSLTQALQSKLQIQHTLCTRMLHAASCTVHKTVLTTQFYTLNHCQNTTHTHTTMYTTIGGRHWPNSAAHTSNTNTARFGKLCRG